MGKRTQLRERANDFASTVRPRVEQARDKAGPMLADARDKAGPMLADAREKASPYVADARERLNRDVIPAVSAAIAAADEATEDARAEGRRRGKAALAALKGGEVEAPRKKHRLRTLLVVLGLGGLAAAVAKKLSDREPTTAWQSSYTPPPAPASPASSDDGSGSHRAESAGDAGAATPDVAAADAEAEPHAATTPDQPAEETDVTKDK